jgi:hypothetical protein
MKFTPPLLPRQGSRLLAPRPVPGSRSSSAPHFRWSPRRRHDVQGEPTKRVLNDFRLAETDDGEAVEPTGPHPVDLLDDLVRIAGQDSVVDEPNRLPGDNLDIGEPVSPSRAPTSTSPSAYSSNETCRSWPNRTACLTQLRRS